MESSSAASLSPERSTRERQSQPRNDFLHHENRAYTEQSTVKEVPWNQFQKNQGQQPERYLMSHPRSSPISIAPRPSAEQSKVPADFETDEDIKGDHDHAVDYDDDSSTDMSGMDMVERDAIRIRRKYGSSVVLPSSLTTALAGTTTNITQEEKYLNANLPGSSLSRALLKAPLLGSLSKSESHLTSLPPISLSDGLNYQEYEDVEPPTEITSYGSLRDSHQRGKFLDGPSSYREPRSGQIRRLDHQRPSTGLSKSHQPSLSIGERIQRNQRRKATLKETIVKSSGGKDTGTSGLAVMMDKASKEEQGAEDETKTDVHLEPLKMSIAANDALSSGGASLSSIGQGLRAFDEDEGEAYDKFDPPTMMSTSLTAFEVLHSTNHRSNHTDRFIDQKILETGVEPNNTSSNRRHPNHININGTNNNNMAARLLSKTEIRDQHFQPLARSHSDPTPHHLQRSPMVSPTLHSLATPTTEAESRLGVPAVPVYEYWSSTTSSPYTSLMSSGMMVHGSDAPMNMQMRVDSARTSNAVENPDTDAAFDMDME